jgi:ABC-2 type transport system ATP-binding protein
VDVIVVDGLVVRYGETVAVDGVSFAVAAGEVVVLLGVNGAGKTTTVEAVEGFRAASAGRITVDGVDPGSDQSAAAQRLGVLLQDVGFPPSARPAEIVSFHAALAGVDVDPVGALATVGLHPARRQTFRRLSGGEQRRVGLAVALLGAPPALVLDEPTTGVDVAGRQLIRQLLAERRAAGAAVLVTTHELDEARRIADRVLILHGGRLVAVGTPDELTDHGRRDFEEVFLAHIQGAP